ncbi:HWE histidine kinase domain-containing protein [Teichococcus vastitatis]|uniref:HWE histidine kinase domain-containing protein n=1 Tax=Teichococcus vastitatis TaxID=2307076 RepID=UPI000E76CB76|nr:HWE histidine kinase domain-containing protein [Pseudoroseomonas vastitatis]
MISTIHDSPAEAPKRPVRGLRLYLLALVMAVLVPALAGGVATAWQLAEAQREQVEASLHSSARAMAVALDRELEVLTTSATSLASWPVLRSAQPDAPGLAEFHSHAADVANSYGGWVAIARGDGTQLLDTREPLGTALPAWRGRLWIEQVLASGRPAVSDMFLAEAGKRPVLAVFAPVRQTGSPAALRGSAEPLVLILAFDPAHLAEVMTEVQPGEIFSAVHTLEGRLIVRSVGRTSAGQPVPSWIAGAVARDEGGLAHGTALDGRSVTSAFQRLDRLPWSAIISIPYDRYSAAWRTPLERLALGGLALLLAGLILALIVARRLLQPIGNLAAEAEALAAGDATPQLKAPIGVAEFEALRLGLHRSTELIRSRAVAEGKVQAAEAVAQALRTERDRARLYFDVARVMLLVLGPDGRVQGINRRGLEVLGLSHENEVIGRDWVSEFLPLAARPAMRLMLERIASGEMDPVTVVHEAPVLRSDGEHRLIAWHNAALRDAEGRLAVIVASGEDVTDPRAAEERQVLLMREVDHRAKNALAVVQSILRMTETPDPADFAATVEGRVSALARAHTLLASENWTGSDLRLLVEAELAGYVAKGQVSIGGPGVWLSPEAVQAVSMVAHELATNAIRHGALAQPGGQVSVQWEATPQGDLRVVWAEQSGPGLRIPRPGRRGFGLRMVDATVRSQFRGRIAYDWRPEGLQCTMTIAAERVSLRGPINPLPASPVIKGPRPPPSRTRRILLAEDEPLVAMELDAQLREMGFTVVGPAATLQQAMDLAGQDHDLLGAVLDVNLGGQAVFPVADLLVRRGVPVVFATGYGSLPGGWATSGGQGRTALLRKPLSRGALAGALRELTGMPDASAEGAALRLQERA